MFVSQPEDFAKMESILASKFGTTVAKQAVAYGRTKTNEDYYLEGKEFKTNTKYVIYVQSTDGNWKIGFSVSAKD